MFNSMRLKHGLFWRRTWPNPLEDYPGQTRKFLLICALLAAINVAVRQEEFLVRAAKDYLLQQNYWELITRCVNGECRFQIGNELFELRGGSLGRAE